MTRRRRRSDGGDVFARGVIVGDSATDNRLMADGVGSVITAAGSAGGVIVGLTGKATGEVKSGGVIASSQGMIVGSEAGATGSLTVTGAGSAIRSPNGVAAVGQFGSGVLAVEAGGLVEALRMFVGMEANASGTMAVTGSATRLNLVRDLSVGENNNSGQAAAQVTVADSALLSAGIHLTVWRGGVVSLAGGRIAVGAVAQPPDPGVLRIGAGGILRLAGSFSGGRIIVDANGRFVPGASPGTAAVTGDLEFAPGSSLVMEIRGAVPGTLHDVVEASGAVTLGGELVLHFIDGFAPASGQTFDLVRSPAATRFGQFPSVRVVGLMTGFQYEVVTDATGDLVLRALSAGVAAPTPQPPALDIAPTANGPGDHMGAGHRAMGAREHVPTGRHSLGNPARNVKPRPRAVHRARRILPPPFSTLTRAELLASEKKGSGEDL